MTTRPRTRRLLATGLAAAVTGTGALVSAPAVHASDAGTVRPSAATSSRLVVASTTTLALDRPTSEFGEPVVATATVTAPGTTPQGSVTFLVDGAATTVKTDPRGVASLVLKDTRVGSHTISATFVPADPVQVTGSSSGPQDLAVVKAPTRTRLGVTGKVVGRPSQALVRVAGEHRTVPTGSVKLVLRKVGRPAATKVKTGTLVKGKRAFNLGKLGRGRYRVRAVYRGDGSHQRSVQRRAFRVRVPR